MDFSNPYSSLLNPMDRTVMRKEWARSGIRRSLVNYPWAVDAKSGEIVVSERDNHRIQIFDSVGQETRFEPFGNYGTGKGEFNLPSGITTTNMPNAAVVVADAGNRRVQFFRVDTRQNGQGILQQTMEFGRQCFTTPTGIELDIRRNCLIITDIGSGRVTMHDVNRGVPFGEFRPRADNPLRMPADVAIDQFSRNFITDASSGCVQVFDQNGDFLFSFGEGLLNKPWGICLDRQQNIIVADEGNNALYKFNIDGNLLKEIATDIYLPKGVSVNSHENLVVTTGDPYNFLKIMSYK